MDLLFKKINKKKNPVIVLMHTNGKIDFCGIQEILLFQWPYRSHKEISNYCEKYVHSWKDDQMFTSQRNLFKELWNRKYIMLEKGLNKYSLSCPPH